MVPNKEPILTNREGYVFYNFSVERRPDNRWTYITETSFYNTI